MVSLFINSTSKYSGKTLVGLGLGLRFKQDGLKIAYLKPLGTSPTILDGVVTDLDAQFMLGALGLKQPLELTTPVVLTQDLIESAYELKAKGLMKKVLEAHEEIGRGKDVVLIGGAGSLFEGGFLNLRGIDLARKLGCRVCLIDRYRSDLLTIDFALDAKFYLKELLSGFIVNKVPPEKVGFIKGKMVPYLENQGIPVWGVIPEEPFLSAISIRSIAEVTGAKVITGEEKLDEFITNIMVGAMTAETALRYFKRVQKKAVITGADRIDMQFAALETPLQCLILTGGFPPNDNVIIKAQENRVPVLSVEMDTFWVVDRVEDALARSEIRETGKVDRAARLIENELDFKRLYKALGLKRPRAR